MAAVEKATGLTAFGPPPLPTYRFVISCKAEKLNIWLENLMTKKQWRTGYLDESAYVTGMNRILNATVEDYVSLFNSTLTYMMSDSKDTHQVADSVKTEKIRRKLTSAEDDGLQLELSVKVCALASAWAAKYTFQLKPISLERIDIVQARLRNVEEELRSTKQCLEEEKAKNVVHLNAASFNVDKLNYKGEILWNSVQDDNFKLLSGRKIICFLVAGWYIVSLKVYLAPQQAGGNIHLLRNSKSLQSDYASSITKENSSASLVCTAYFNAGDQVSVVATHSPRRVGAVLSAMKIA